MCVYGTPRVLEIMHVCALYSRSLFHTYNRSTITLAHIHTHHAQLQREQAVIELEKVQVKELLAQGYPPQELQRMGMTLDPQVLQDAGKQK